MSLSTIINRLELISDFTCDTCISISYKCSLLHFLRMRKDDICAVREMRFRKFK